jgi:hypothetical protein
MNGTHEGVYIVVERNESGGIWPERSTERAKERGSQR